MQLCDKDIYLAMAKGDLLFVGTNPQYPFLKEKQVQPASVDLRIGNRFIKFKQGINKFDIKDIKDIEQYLIQQYINDGDQISVNPGEILFAQVYEQISIPDYLSARIEGRSRVARLGISVHCTGDYINPGFAGAMPLQIVNHNSFPIILYPYISICQMILYKLTNEPLISYLQRSVLPYNTYYNETNPSPSILSNETNDGNKEKESVLEKRIRILIENYYNTIEKDDLSFLKLEKSSSKSIEEIIKEALQVNLINIEGGFQMGDNYYAKQVGAQGKKAGTDSYIYQQYFDNDNNDITKDFEKVQAYIIKDYSGEDREIIIENLEKASLALRNNRREDFLNILKNCGKTIFNIGKEIGCKCLTQYLLSVLGQ